MIADERRKKVLNNLVREVQFAYWRMVAAQKLEDRVKEAVTKAEEALLDAEQVELEKLSPPNRSASLSKTVTK